MDSVNPDGDTGPSRYDPNTVNLSLQCFNGTALGTVYLHDCFSQFIR